MMRHAQMLGNAYLVLRSPTLIAGLVFSAFLLTVLFMMAGAVPHDVHYGYTLELRSLRQADAEINAEVLASRLELSRNYDILSARTTHTRQAAERLLKVPGYLSAGDQSAVSGIAGRLRETVVSKADLVDRFERDNAILRNSLAYFPNAVNAYFARAHNPTIGQLVGRYARHVLAYARVPDSLGLARVSTAEKQLRGQAGGSDGQVVDNLLLHGSIIMQELSSVDRISRELTTLRTNRQMEELHEVYMRGYAHAEQRAERFRVLLFVLALLLAIYLILTFSRLLRTRGALADANRALQERFAAQVMVEERLRLHATAFDNAHEGITLTNASGEILDVNPAFTRITGFERSEVIGRNPRVLKSGRHDQAFYAAMWKSILETGTWRGEIWNRSKYGDVYPELLSISAVRDDAEQVTNFVAVFSDITRLKEQEKQLVQMAYFDALTGLPNRALLADRIVQAAALTRRNDTLMAVCYLDLDGFKPINDTWGHDVGDQLLIEMANRFKSAIRAGDTVARLGGDEFVLLMLGLTDQAECERAVQRLLHVVAMPFLLADKPITLSASIGMALFPLDDGDADTLLRHADQAMYRAKQTGKNRFDIFDPDQDRNTRSRYDRVARIQDALDYEEIVVHYQPKVDMRSGQVVGAEALVRWQHPERGLLLPGDFLPLVEEHDIVIRLGEVVIESALRQMEEWLASGVALPVSVNIAGRHLQHPGFVQSLNDAQKRHPSVAGQLELEVVETTALEDMSRVSRIIDECNALGITFALDDFGTGYSSLTYLKRLPVTAIKIDQSFVGDMLSDPNNLVIVQGVIGLTKAFQRRAIAEGVETIEHGRLLMQLECDCAQGFGIARPMPGSEIPRWLSEWQPPHVWRSIANLHWESADYPMLMAVVEHRNWVAQVVHAVRDGSPIPHRYIDDFHYCRFGQWYDDPACERYAVFPVFERIGLEHRRLHAIADEVDALMREGRIEAARSHIKIMIEHEQRITELMLELELLVAKPR